jgi:hypothetical protein
VGFRARCTRLGKVGVGERAIVLGHEQRVAAERQRGLVAAAARAAVGEVCFDNDGDGLHEGYRRGKKESGREAEAVAFRPANARALAAHGGSGARRTSATA